MALCSSEKQQLHSRRCQTLMGRAAGSKFSYSSVDTHRKAAGFTFMQISILNIRYKVSILCVDRLVNTSVSAQRSSSTLFSAFTNTLIAYS